MKIDNILTMAHALAGAPGVQDNSRVVLNSANQLSLDGKVKVLQYRNGASKEANRQIRQMLLDALNEKFEGLGNIPESVRRAMKLGKTASGFGISKDGRSITVGNRPLTMRRIMVILNAVAACKSTADLRVACSPRDALSALTGSVIDKQSLAHSMNMLQQGLDTLCRRGTFSPVTMDRVAEGHLAAAVQGLTNKELLQAFHNLGTDDYRDFAATLPKGAQCNLFILEALITRELGHRALQQIAPGEYEAASTVEAHGSDVVTEADVVRHEDDHDLSPRNALALANVETVGNVRKENVGESFVRKTAADASLESADFKRVGDYLRKTPLTMNVDANYFFSSNGPLSFLGGIWKNIFHAKEAGISVKGLAYEAKRNAVEAAYYPEFGTCETLSAKERPTYAAINTNGSKSGESRAYGAVCVKFKPEVNRRAVYTVSDSFLSVHVKVTKEKIGLILKALPNLSDLSDDVRVRLADPESKLSKDINEFLAGLAEEGETTADKVKFHLVPGLGENDGLLIDSAVIGLCKIEGQTRAKNMATYDNIESLLSSMRHVDAVKLIKASRENLNLLHNGYDYIEAQIHGDIRIPEDIEAITISQTSLSALSDEKRAFFRAAVEVANGRDPAKKVPDMFAKLGGEQKKRLKDIRKALNGRTLNITWLSSAEEKEHFDRTNISTEQVNDFAVEHFDKKQAVELIDMAERSPLEASRQLGEVVSLLGPMNVGEGGVMLPESFVNRVRERLEYYSTHRNEVRGLKPKSGEASAIVGQLFKLIFYELVSPAMRRRLDAFVKAAKPVTEDSRRVIRQVLDGKKMSLAEMKRAAGLVEYPRFPEAAQTNKLPQTPSGRRQFLLDMLPIYHEREKPGGFDHGAGAHGRGHICRTFIFAETMANIMSSRGYEIDRAALAMGIVGHDSGRTRIGEDASTVEKASAEQTLAQAKVKYGAEAMGKKYEEEFERCIVGHESPTIEGVLLNSADSLDAGRTKDFDMKFFPFLRADSKTGEADTDEDDGLRHALQREAALLGFLTDPQCAGRKLYMAAREKGEDELAVECSSAMQQDVIKQQEQDDAVFLKSVEDAIRQYPDQFPLLTEYYLNPLS